MELTARAYPSPQGAAGSGKAQGHNARWTKDFYVSFGFNNSNLLRVRTFPSHYRLFFQLSTNISPSMLLLNNKNRNKVETHTCNILSRYKQVFCFGLFPRKLILLPNMFKISFSSITIHCLHGINL